MGEEGLLGNSEEWFGISSIYSVLMDVHMTPTWFSISLHMSLTLGQELHITGSMKIDNCYLRVWLKMICSNYQTSLCSADLLFKTFEATSFPHLDTVER